MGQSPPSYCTGQGFIDVVVDTLRRLQLSGIFCCQEVLRMTLTMEARKMSLDRSASPKCSPAFPRNSEWRSHDFDWNSRCKTRHARQLGQYRYPAHGSHASVILPATSLGQPPFRQFKLERSHIQSDRSLLHLCSPHIPIAQTILPASISSCPLRQTGHPARLPPCPAHLTLHPPPLAIQPIKRPVQPARLTVQK